MFSLSKYKDDWARWCYCVAHAWG